MAHAFDNRNLIPGKQQTFYSAVSPTTRPDVTNVLWEASTPSPRGSILSPKPNHPPPSYEESVFNKALANRQHSRSSLHSPSFRYYPNSPNPLASYSLPSTPNDCRQAPPSEAFVSLHRSSDTKPPPPARMPKNPPQYSPSGMKTSTTYLNTTQLYISQPPSRDPPPPPPPRYPLQPPVIPPRNSSMTSAPSPQPTNQTISRTPVVISTAKRNDLVDCQSLERQFHSLVIEKNREYSMKQCRKCHETINNDDETCEILGQIYHSSCATCVICGRSVRNKHYFVKDQLYCEEDFLYTGFHQTLEHCVACNHLITDTILQALGRSYHLSCFKCSKCSLSLDGVPFITDKNQNLFCLHDYHMTYGPRCDKCANPICPEDNSNETVRIISMGKTFHVQCYQCQDCSLQLNDESDRRCYPLGDILLCQGCCRRRLASSHHQ